mgnify:CR=1 FL=1
MRFEKYFQPTSIEECVSLLKEYGTDAKMLAGGTDLVPRLKNKVIRPKAVIGLFSIPNIDKIALTEAGIMIGSMVQLRHLQKAEELGDRYVVIKEAAGHVSSMQVRNIGGNACNASPSADAVQGLMVMDAVCKIDGVNGKRDVAIANFFIGPGKTVLENGEILTGFFIPAPKPRTGTAYEKFAIRGDTDISIVGAGCSLTLCEDGTVTDARISLASVAPKPIRATEAENFLIGKKITETIAREAGKLAASNCKPISDQRASKEYRVEMVKVWVKNAILEAKVRI